MTITQEAAFEANIEAHLLGDGWHRLEPTALVHFAVDPTGWR